jgi:hypothetical protein
MSTTMRRQALQQGISLDRRAQKFFRLSPIEAARCASSARGRVRRDQDLRPLSREIALIKPPKDAVSLRRSSRRNAAPLSPS